MGNIASLIQNFNVSCPESVSCCQKPDSVETDNVINKSNLEHECNLLIKTHGNNNLTLNLILLHIIDSYNLKYGSVSAIISGTENIVAEIILDSGLKDNDMPLISIPLMLIGEHIGNFSIKSENLNFDKELLHEAGFILRELILK